MSTPHFLSSVGAGEVTVHWPWMARVHDATGKTFEVEFCPVARWQNGEIVEENLFYDQVGFLRQIGVL